MAYYSAGTYVDPNTGRTYSGANFTITTGNPHRITYVGSSSMIGKIEVNASQFVNANTADPRVGILKNGVTALNSVVPFSSSRDADGVVIGNVNWILPIASGDYFQVGIYTNNIATSFNNSTFQMAITRVI